MWHRSYGPVDWVALSLFCVFLVAALALVTRIWRPGVGRGLGATLVPLLASLTLAAWPWEPVIREHVIPIEGLRKPLTIAHLSDPHLTSRLPTKWRNHRCAERAVALVKQIDPDLVVLTGDYVDRSADFAAVGELFGALGKTWPTYAVLGNHDYWEVEWPDQARTRRGAVHSESDWAKLLNARLLRNESRRVPGTGIWIIGVDDPVTGRDDIARAMRGVPPSAAKIVLAHTPDIFRKAARARVDLLLAGHTHGGQVWLPLIGPLYTHSLLPRRLRVQLATGCRWVPLPGGKRMHIAVTSGLGVTSDAPLRLGCPAEVTKIVLVPRESLEARQSPCNRPGRRLEFQTVLDPWLQAK